MRHCRPPTRESPSPARGRSVCAFCGGRACGYCQAITSTPAFVRAGSSPLISTKPILIGVFPLAGSATELSATGKRLVCCGNKILRGPSSQSMVLTIQNQSLPKSNHSVTAVRVLSIGALRSTRGTDGTSRNPRRFCLFFFRRRTESRCWCY
jgi:hypothetical protein